MTNTACPNQHQVAGWVLGRLGPGLAAQVEAHLAGCAVCSAAADALDTHADPLTSQLRGVPQGSTADSELDALLSRAAAILSPDASTASTEDLPAALVGEYELLGELGRGGMGVVHKARHRRLNREVALKVLPAGRLTPAAEARFDRETKAAALLQHPNTAITWDAGRHGGRPYLAMELVPGTTLKDLLRGDPLPVALACDLARQAALGLQHAHERGLVHRDVKPSNLMVTPSGVVKVLDLGLASLRGADGGLTEPGRFLGTADYVAPEQIDDAASAGPPADIYSLGCTLYHLLAGRPPFPDGDLWQKLAAHRERTPTPLARLRPDCPREVIDVVNQMMHKRPERRPGSASAVATALEPFCRPAGTTVTAPEPRPAPRRPRRWPVAAAVALGAVALGVTLWLTLLAPDGTLRVKTGQGTLVLEFPGGIPPKIDVLVDGSKVTLKNVDKERGEITVDVGEREVVVRDGGTIHRKEKVEIVRDRQALLRVQVERPPPVAGGKDDTRPAGEAACLELKAPVGHVAFSPDGRRLVAVTAMNAYLYDLSDVKNPREVRVWPRPASYFFHRARFSTDGKKVFCAVGWSSEVAVRTYSLAQQDAESAAVVKHGSSINVLEVTEDGQRFVTGDGVGKVAVRDRAGKPIAEFAHPEALCVALSRDGRSLLSGGADKTARLWDVQKGGKETVFGGHKHPVIAVALSPDGKRAFTVAGDRTGLDPENGLRIWDAGGKELSHLKLGDQLSCAAFSPDSRRMLAGYRDGKIILWDVEKLQRVVGFAGHKQMVTALAFSADGRHAASGDAPNGTVRLWRLPAP